VIGRVSFRNSFVGLTRLFATLCCLALIVSFAHNAPANETGKEKPKWQLEEEASFLKPFQRLSLGVPPLPPARFNPDPKTSAFPPKIFEKEITFQFDRRISESTPQPPTAFNPDPATSAKTYEPFFRTNFGLFSVYGEEPVEEEFALPREHVRLKRLVTTPEKISSNYGNEPLPKHLELPRTNTLRTIHLDEKFENPEYPLAEKQLGYPANSVPMTNRWKIGFTPWRRYTSGDTETPYQNPTPRLWHPYQQSILKGDVPIIGQDIFLNLTAGSQTEFEMRRLPTPSGVSSARANSAEFFGQSEQFSLQQNFSFSAELFKGETVFQPVHWALTLRPVFNLNYLEAKETGVVNPDPRGSDFRDNAVPPDNSGVVDPGDIDDLLNPPGPSPNVSPAPSNFSGKRYTTRFRSNIALQEAAVEYHLGDLSVNYDFFAMKAGIQTFNSDFRGFIFNDSNLGARLFGSFDNNRFQYNVAAFDLFEKDTFSDLNTFDKRDQRVIVANVYRQDFLRHGYTAQWSFHANLDQGGVHYDRSGNITRPAPIGTVAKHDVNAFYFGWTGDGHIGRLNINHALYQVVGRDDLNGVAGRPTDINAQMAALELSYDRDWIRYKGSLFYASGDDRPEDGTATGFDSITDNANFTGGPFSYFVHQGFNLAGSSVSLKARNSLLPDLRTSKTEGQANFVNPGVIVLGVGMEMDLTPKLRSFLNLNYLRFAETDVIKTVLQTAKISSEIGFDFSLGFQYRPLLTDNIIISAGFGTLIPGKGYGDIYRRNTQPVFGYGSNQTGKADDFLYSAVLAVTFTY
jgi:hypothetical protein